MFIHVVCPYSVNKQYYDVIVINKLVILLTTTFNRLFFFLIYLSIKFSGIEFLTLNEAYLKTTFYVFNSIKFSVINTLKFLVIKNFKIKFKKVVFTL